jgi:mono/diheme cytochrome c family protein
MRYVISGAVSLMIVLTAASAGAQDKKAPEPKAIERGQKVYADQKCSMCHSLDGKPRPVGPLDDVGARLSEEDIRQWLLSPRVMAEKAKSTRKPLMPEYTKLSKEDLGSLVAYLKTLDKKK